MDPAAQASILAHPVVHAAVVGTLTAAAIDIQAFRAMKSFDELKTYSWSVAIFRWVQGAALGALAGAGLGAAT